MIAAGLDWSMSCPCICIYDTKKEFKFENCTFYYYINKKKYDTSIKNMHGFKIPLTEGNQERFDDISQWGIDIMTKNHVDEACLEGYSMGSKGMIFDIAENIGLLKYKMWKAGIPFITPSPTSVKKEFSGKGNSNKQLMYEALQKKGLDLDLETLLQCAASNSPLADITDSFALVDYLLNNKNLR